MTDKTSTAPVMSLQQVRDYLRSPKMVGVLDQTEMLADAIDAHLTAPIPDVVGGDVVVEGYDVARHNAWLEANAAPRVRGDAEALVCIGIEEATRYTKASGHEHYTTGAIDAAIRAALAAQPKGDAPMSFAEHGKKMYDAGFAAGQALLPAEQPRGEVLAYHVSTAHEKWLTFDADAAEEMAADTGGVIRRLGEIAQPKPEHSNSPVFPDGSMHEQTRGDGVDAVSYSVEAVAEVVHDAGGQNKLSFVVEGAEASLEVGTMLYAIPFMTPPDDGSVELYDAPRQAVPEFTRTKPSVPGYYLVRGYTWPYKGEAYEKQAAVEVRQRDDGLVVNLHEKNSDEDMDRWYLVETIDSNFEWAMIAAAPSAGRMGVE